MTFRTPLSRARTSIPFVADLPTYRHTAHIAGCGAPTLAYACAAPARCRSPLFLSITAPRLSATACRPRSVCAARQVSVMIKGEYRVCVSVTTHIRRRACALALMISIILDVPMANSRTMIVVTHRYCRCHRWSTFLYYKRQNAQS